MRQILTTFANAFRKECKVILLNTLSFTTLRKEQIINIGTVPKTGADFPYLMMACGEPREVWRRSAPLYNIQLN